MICHCHPTHPCAFGIGGDPIGGPPVKGALLFFAIVTWPPFSGAVLSGVASSQATDVPDVPPRIDFGEAVQAAEAIPNDFQRGKVLVEIAAAMPGKGDHPGSRPLARRGLELVRGVIDAAQDERRKGYLLVQLALLQDSLGDRRAARQSLDRAIASAKGVAPPNVRLDLLQFIAHSLAQVGDFEGAQRKTEIVT